MNESVDNNKLYFEYVGPAKDIRFYEYMNSKELFDEIKDNWLRFDDALKKQKELLKKINEVKMGKITSEQENVITSPEIFWDIDKLVPVPVNLRKLSDVVKNDVVKKTVYDTLVAKVNSIDTSRFVLKTKYDRDKPDVENKIPDTSGLVKKTDYTKIEDKVPSICGLATNTALTADENKIPNIVV